jgi:spermidine synthase
MAERSQLGMSVRFETLHVADQRHTPHTHSLLVDTRWQGRVLLMDSEVQFAEADEHRYHEMLVHPAVAVAPSRLLRVLILGGGDGLAAREVLKWDNRIQSVTIVDYDAEFVSQVAKPLLRYVNGGSLDDPRVSVVHSNAVTFARNTRDKFDVILLDLPDPDEHGYAQLYLDLLYACETCLGADGVLVTHTGAMALTAAHPCWSFLTSLRTTARNVYGNDCRVHFRTVHVPSFVHPWGFFYVTPRRLVQSPLLPEVAQQCRFLDPVRLEHTLTAHGECVGDKDIREIYYDAIRHA